MFPVSRTPRPAPVSRMLLCLLLLAVSLRAMIPLGYMPDTTALRQGVVRISLCTSTGVVTILQDLRGDHTAGAHNQALHADIDHDGHDHSGSGNAAGAECPFWVTAHLAAYLPPEMVGPILVATRDQAVHFLTNATLPPLPAAGPPLGSRAPPSA